MGRAVFGLLLGFVIVFGVAFWARTCLPKPGEDVEWLQREDVIVVQMKVSGGLPEPEIIARLTPPSFTLYGDGTLLLAKSGYSNGNLLLVKPDYGDGFIQATLSLEQVRGLIQFIKGEGFLDFSYEQPTPGCCYDFPTTFFYLNTIGAANSVSAYALGMGPSDGGNEWTQVHHLETIRTRLIELANAARAGANARDYTPEGGVLLAVSMVANDFIGVPPWPFPGVEVPLSNTAGEVKERTLSNDEVASLDLPNPHQTKCWNQVQFKNTLADVCYRPALPYEENFPEFGPPLYGPGGTPIPSPPS